MSDVTDFPDDTAEDAARLVEIVAGVYAWIQPDGSWWINNAGAVSDADEVLIIDTCATANRTQRFLDAVQAAIGDARIRVAVNTHLHGDHTYGNCLLPSTAVLVGHELMRAGLERDTLIDGCPPLWEPVPDWGAVHTRLPDITVSSNFTVYVGTRRVDVLHPGQPAHTDGDLVAWLPAERVLFAGDLLFAGLTPLVFMGSLTGALAALDWLAAFDPDVIVPGHGPIVTRTDIDRVLDQHRAYYRLVIDAAEFGMRRDLSPLDAAREIDLGSFAQWADAERLVLNIHRAYCDRHNAELDIQRAFSDATTWLGRPLHTGV